MDRLESLTPPIPREGGMVVMNDVSNLGQCCRCGWIGPPLKQDASGPLPRRGGRTRRWPARAISTLCPVCNVDALHPKPAPATAMLRQASKPKVARNAPCPCGSGKKAKKCCHP